MQHAVLAAMGSTEMCCYLAFKKVVLSDNFCNKLIIVNSKISKAQEGLAWWLKTTLKVGSDHSVILKQELFFPTIASLIKNQMLFFFENKNQFD